MGRTGKRNEPVQPANDKKAEKAKQPLPPPEADDDLYNDGDIATPKRDRYGSDDEPY